MSKPIFEININNLKVLYDEVLALEIKDFNISGNTIAVIGHNGSGKSTLIKTILELLVPSEGAIELSIVEESKKTRLIPNLHMAYSPESGAVFGDVSIEEYLQLWSSLKHNSRNYYRKKYAELLEVLEIEPLRKKLGRELSKGQKRRVQTLVGFICEPKLFLLDEPFDGLDISQTNLLINLITKKSEEMAFVISSHRMEVVEKLADKLIVLDRGKITHAASVSEVIERISARECSLIDAMNIYLQQKTY
ncbi:MAG: ABC transporter ATP-binding protein [Proteobacteria bacterium]|nr:ABC transporter ATP-binding protein [Pseudomonadota bacterium]